jgi:hypothetical protein
MADNIQTRISSWEIVLTSNSTSSSSLADKADATSDPTGGNGYFVPEGTSYSTSNIAHVGVIGTDAAGETAEVQVYGVEKRSTLTSGEEIWTHTPLGHFDFTLGTRASVETNEFYADTVSVSTNVANCVLHNVASGGDADFANSLAWVDVDYFGCVALYFQVKIGTMASVNVLCKGY